MKKAIIIILILLGICSCTEDKGKEEIIKAKDVGVTRDGELVYRALSFRCTGRVKVEIGDGDYILYGVDYGKLDGKTVIMDRENKEIGYGYYTQGKKNGKFMLRRDGVIIEAEYKDDKLVGDYKFSTDKENLSYVLNGNRITVNIQNDEKSTKDLQLKGTATFKDKWTLEFVSDIDEKNKEKKQIKQDLPYVPLDEVFRIKTEKKI